MKYPFEDPLSTAFFPAVSPEAGDDFPGQLKGDLELNNPGEVIDKFNPQHIVARYIKNNLLDEDNEQ